MTFKNSDMLNANLKIGRGHYLIVYEGGKPIIHKINQRLTKAENINQYNY